MFIQKLIYAYTYLNIQVRLLREEIIRLRAVRVIRLCLNGVTSSRRRESKKKTSAWIIETMIPPVFLRSRYTTVLCVTFLNVDVIEISVTLGYCLFRRVNVGLLSIQYVYNMRLMKQ